MSADEDAVVEYLAALEARRAAPPDFPQPERIAGDLASGAMVEPEDEPEAESLRRQVGAYTPGADANLARLEAGFVSAAKEYGRRRGMTYEAWVEAGVDAEVLARAGISPDAT